jgi:hypothetical protein
LRRRYERGVARDRMIMGLLKLLTFPVSAPMAGGRWVIRTLVDEAERRYYDPAAIRQEIEEIERRHQAGELDDEAFENLEDSLLQRLLDAREYQKRKQAESEDASE